MKNNLEDLTDDELYASYEAYKALIDAGLTKDQALSRTGLTAQIVRDFEAEEEDMDLKSDFKEVWDEDSDYDESEWNENDLEEDFDDDEWESSSEDYDEYGGDSGSWDDRY